MKPHLDDYNIETGMEERYRSSHGLCKDYSLRLERQVCDV
jgi:hypothetical protein